MTTAPAATEPGLAADYPFDEGQGLIAHDLTSNQNDGTLAGPNGDVPTWVIPSGEAIDLGNDGITYNSTSPRQGPEQLPEFPHRRHHHQRWLEGWLGGSTPDTTYRIDVFAGAGFAAGGAGQAEVYLGSLEVTTDASGQAGFEVPYAPPPGLPVSPPPRPTPLVTLPRCRPRRRADLQAPRRSSASLPVSRKSSLPPPAMASPCKTRTPGHSSRPGI